MVCFGCLVGNSILSLELKVWRNFRRDAKIWMKDTGNGCSVCEMMCVQKRKEIDDQCKL